LLSQELPRLRDECLPKFSPARQTIQEISGLVSHTNLTVFQRFYSRSAKLPTIAD
jgi:hypothetical protein